ncbi:MAG: FG-GAP-like repeat-containing protein [Candidatus Latescibacterota bacterium]
MPDDLTCPGDWPLWRRDRLLTAHQPLPGALAKAPRVLAETDLGADSGPVLAADLEGSGRARGYLVLARARLHAFDAGGRPLWEASPAGYWLQEVLAVADLDGDGRPEVLLLAGRLGYPCLALVVLEAADGRLRAAHAFNAGQFGFSRFCGPFFPGHPGQQVVLVTSGWQDERKTWATHGHIGLLELRGDSLAPLWDLEVAEYPIEYPATLIGELGADGRKQVVVDSWCHVWSVDLASGRALSHTTWDPGRANGRHYGWNQLTRIAGRPAFVNLALTKHVDVLLADAGGRLELAWTRGWPDPVTTEARSLACPGDPVADVDGDGIEEVVVGLFDGLTESRWHLLALDGLTGATRAEALDLVPLATTPLGGTRGSAVLCARCPTYARQEVAAYEVWAVREGAWTQVWRADGPFLLEGVTSTEVLAVGFNGLNAQRAVVADVDADAWPAFFTGPRPQARAWGVDGNGAVVRRNATPPEEPARRGPELPALRGRGVGHLLAADVRGRGRNHLLAWDGSAVQEWILADGRLHAGFTLPSLDVPAVCPLLGDGVPCLVTGDRGPDGNLRVTASRFAGEGNEPQTLWRFTFASSQGCGQYLQALFVAVGRFTGSAGYDVFSYTTKPGARACLLDGRTGQVRWERDEIPGIERHFQAMGGRVAAWDLDGDGEDDLLFCCPDYYCAADGRTGEWHVAPVFLPDLTGYWSAYSSPAVLQEPAGEPVVYLGGAYESRTSIRPDGKARLWSEFLPAERWGLMVDSRQRFHEGLLPPEGSLGWRVVQAQVDGTLVCLEPRTGQHAWEVSLASAPAPVVSGDVDGDGRCEFLLAGQDGTLSALRDAGARPEEVWSLRLGGPVGPVILADLDGDGTSEIAAAVGDGRLVVLGR